MLIEYGVTRMRRGIYLFLFMIVMLIAPKSVLAESGFIINGGGSGVGTGTGGSSNWSCVSPYANGWVVGVRFTLVYYDGTTIVKVQNSSSKDIWSASTASKYYYGSTKVTGIGSVNLGYTYTKYSNPFIFSREGKPGSTCSKSLSGTDYSIYAGNGLFYCNSSFPNVYSATDVFFSATNQAHLANNMGDWFGVEYSYDKIEQKVLSGEHISSTACNDYYTNGTGEGCKGYRIIMEPIIQFVVNNDNSKLYALTLSEAAQLLQQCTGTTTVDTSKGMGGWLANYSKMLYTSYKDVGIDSGQDYINSGQNLVAGLASSTIGLGMNIIDPTFGKYDMCKLTKTYLPSSGVPIEKQVWLDIDTNKFSESQFLTKYKNYFGKNYLPTTLYKNPDSKQTITYEDFAKQCLPKPTCEQVEASNPTIKANLANALNYGTVESFKSGYSSGINYKNTEGTTETASVDWYVTSCSPTSGGGGTSSTKIYNCTPNYKVSTCLGATSGDTVYNDDTNTYNDSTYWDNCVYQDNGFYTISTHKTSTTSTSGSLTYSDNTLGGQYCDVYCIEDLTTRFNKNTVVVQAGQHFVWEGNEVEGKRTCKTKSIDWASYNADATTANANVKSTYIDWQLEILASQVSWTPSAVNDCNWTCDEWDTIYYDYDCNCSTTDGETTCSTCEGSFTYCVSSSPKSKIYHPSTNYISFWGKPMSFGDTCGGAGYYANVAAKKAAYDNALAVAAGVTTEMSKCYTWNDSNVYNLSPVGSVSYSDGTYSYNGQLVTSTSYEPTAITNDCKTVTAPNYTSCSGTACYTGSTVSFCTYNNETRSGKATFSLPQDGIFQYVLKSNNKSINANEITNYSSSNITANYINIGYSNFPVAYSTPDGTYDTLSLKYSKLGHLKNGSTDLDSILSSSSVNTNNDYTKWNCEFTVVSNLITPKDDNNGGINLIYRTIDLDNPFPDIDGTGRTPGGNWCSANEACTKSNSFISKVITNNRGVTTDEIYNEEPMYSFTMTPSIIKEIRKYNNANSYAEYTGTLDGKTYDFKCTTGEGTECISEYVTYLINLTNATGTCVNDSARSTSEGSTFKTCR